MKNNICLICVVLCSLALEAYGIVLSTNGYEPPQEGVGARIALAVLSLREGIFPWNMNNDNGMLLSAEQEQEPEEISEPEEEVPVVTEGAEASETVEQTPEAVSDTVSEAEVIEDVTEPEEEEPWPVFQTVTDEYFSDAVFIGDSRTVGVCEYAGIEGSTFYAKTSMTIYKMLDSRVETTRDVRTVREGLENNQFRKVYLMVGINEIGVGNTEYFINKYREVVEEIQQMQPNALIYIQGIMHVSGRLDQKRTEYNNTAINIRNEALCALAEEMHAVYLDVNEAYDDEDGNLPASFTADDVHLKANHYDLWHEFYLSHAVEVPPVTEMPADDPEEKE